MSRPIKPRLVIARDTRHCACSTCPSCGTFKNVHWRWTLPAQFGGLQRLWWTAHYCPACGSRWAAWHRLEVLTGLTWRRVYALAPGTFSAAQTAQLVAMRRAYRRNGGEA